MIPDPKKRLIVCAETCVRDATPTLAIDALISTLRDMDADLAREI
jgi:hypothetical protein